MTDAVQTLREKARFAMQGQVVAMVTPFTATGEVDHEAAARIVEWHIGCGVGAIFVSGDNGEFWALDRDGLAGLTATAKKAAAGRVPVYAGTSAITTGETVQLSAAAAEAGADGLGIQPQSYLLHAKPSEIVGRFAAVAKAVPLPVMVYNSPSRTGVNITPDTLEAICGACEVVGVKEASGDFRHVTQIIRRFRARIAVLVGAGHFIVPGLDLGAAGYLSTGPELWGGKARRIMELAGRGFSEEKLEWHGRITEVFNILMDLETRPAAFKRALTLVGVPAGEPHEPVEPLSPAGEARLREVLARNGILGAEQARRLAS